MIGLPTLRNTTYKPKERNVLDLFTVEGEGGYLPSQFTFMFKSSCFFNNNIKGAVVGVMADPSQIKTVVFGNETFNYRNNILRIVLGNKNQCIMYRDGSFDISKEHYTFPEFGNIIPQIRDNFCPSTYATENHVRYQQMFLLENGDLVNVNLWTKQITPLLTGVQKFLNKNQAHRCDAIVGLKNGDMYQVWCGPSPHHSGNDGNKTPTGVQKIPDIKHTDIKFCTIGDPPGICTICFKSEPNKLYRFIKGYGVNFKITGVQSTPAITLNSDEYFIDGMANEYDLLLITNKKLYHKYAGKSFTNTSWIDQWVRDLYPASPTISNPIIKAKKIVTPTAYTMIIEDVDGKYWFCSNPYSDDKGYALRLPISYTFFDTLKVNLEPIRESS
jgi:hypothetical protein